MKSIYFTVGPSQLYPTVPTHIKNALQLDIPSISHRSKQFQVLYAETAQSLRKLMRIPKTHHVFFLSSALEAMERTLQNTVTSHSFHFVNGAFSKKWYQFAIDLGKKPEKIDIPLENNLGENAFFGAVCPELICVTQNETSTGMYIPLSNIYALKKKCPKSLIAIDIVSSAPYPIIDFSKIDIAFFSVQKGFGLPAGLCVFIVSEKAIQKSIIVSKTNSIGTYHSFASLLKMEEKFQTPETPNVLYLYLLNQICKDMLKKGIKTIRKEIDAKAKHMYQFARTSNILKPFIKHKRFQSPTTIVLEVLGKSSDEIVSKLKMKGLVIGKGYGENKDKHIRIANFPAHSIKNIKRVLAELKN